MPREYLHLTQSDCVVIPLQVRNYGSLTLMKLALLRYKAHRLALPTTHPFPQPQSHTLIQDQMATTSPVAVIAGFSVTNRLLLYANVVTAPAAFMGGIGTNIPVNAGFLGYTLYQQYLFYVAAKHKQLHALSMLPHFLNLMYAFTYCSGMIAGNYWLSYTMGIGTIAALIVNNITTWTAYTTNLPEGYGVYQFFFFGWRTLTHKWRILFLLWGVADTLVTLSYISLSKFLADWAPAASKGLKDDDEFRLANDTSLIWGSIMGLIVSWPFILWTELIVQRNHVVSDTDWISVYLFIVQISLLALPIAYSVLQRLWRTRGNGGPPIRWGHFFQRLVGEFIPMSMLPFLLDDD